MAGHLHQRRAVSVSGCCHLMRPGERQSWQTWQSSPPRWIPQTTWRVLTTAAHSREGIKKLVSKQQRRALHGFRKCPNRYGNERKHFT